jgi:hypothetical protein
MNLSRTVGIVALACASQACGAPDEATPGLASGEVVTWKSSSSLACFGDRAPLVVTNGLPFAEVDIGVSSVRGHFLIDYATTTSVIDLSALGALAPHARRCDPKKLGETCSFSPFSFFGGWGEVSLYTEDLSSFSGSVREAGILGTDLLSQVALTLDFVEHNVFRARPGALCSDATLEAAGFVSLSSAGYFASDTSALVGLASVVAGVEAAPRVPNVPTVPLRIGNTTAVAQLDTGFDDALVPFSVNVNEALYHAIALATPHALVRKPSADLALTTCAGVAEAVEAYTLAPGFDLALVDTSGKAAKTYRSATLFVKRTPLEARRCGGIGTWSTPAVQIGASFYSDLGVLVFDPFTSRVWVRSR